MLVRRHRDEVDQVLQLGEQLREAQSALSGDRLRELDRQRRQVTSALTRQARQLGRDLGEKVSDTVATQVEETLRAAMTDPAAAAALGSGLLTDHFAATGVEPVDLTGLVAVPEAAESAPAPPQPSPVDERAREEAARDVEDAERRLRDAEERVAEARRAVEDSRARAEDREKELQQLRKRLRDAEDEARTAQRDQQAAEKDAERAEKDGDAARRALDRARARLDSLQ